VGKGCFKFIQLFWLSTIWTWAQPVSPVHVHIEGPQNTPFVVKLNGLQTTSQAVPTLTLMHLDTNMYQMVILNREYEVMLQRNLQLTSPGIHRYVFQIDRTGQWVLRYRGTLEILPVNALKINVKQLNIPPTTAINKTKEVTETPPPSLPPKSAINAPAPRPTTPITPTGKPSLSGALEALEQKATEFEKLAFLKSFVAENQYNTEDLMILTSKLKYEHTRLQFLTYAYGGCANREAYGILESLLEFETSLEGLRIYIANFKD
jgi:hypothetical protein